MTAAALSEVEGLTRRERIMWAAGIVLVAAGLILTHFTSKDPDSALYAGISERMSAQPISHWIAPYWFALWPGSDATQLFREHPAGIFIVPMTLARLGFPAAQSAYFVGVLAGLASLLLIGSLVSRLMSRDDGRAAIVLLQLMPAAFIFRIRSNHEYPMLVCLLLCLLGLEGLRRSRSHAALVAAGIVGGVLIKGVFVVPILIAAGLWIVIDPAQNAARVRQIAAVVGSLALTAVVVVIYDAIYRRVTGESFWSAYWQRQLAPVTMTTPIDDSSGFFSQFGFYALRLLWHPFPWSVAVIWLGVRQTMTPAESHRRTPLRERRALIFTLAFAAVLIVMFSLPSRFAERYVFSAMYALGTLGAIVAFRASTWLRRAFSRLDAALPGWPAMLWTTLVLLRLAAGPWLPRIQDR